MPVDATSAVVHPADVLAGSVVVRICPSWSLAKHKVLEGQLTAQIVLLPSMSVLIQVACGPEAGSVEVNTPPSPSTATQSVTLGQDRPQMTF
jgi:hypothetical protein